MVRFIENSTEIPQLSISQVFSELPLNKDCKEYIGENTDDVINEFS